MKTYAGLIKKLGTIQCDLSNLATDALYDKTKKSNLIKKMIKNLSVAQLDIYNAVKILKQLET